MGLNPYKGGHDKVCEQYTLDGDFVAKYKSQLEASIKTGVRKNGISMAINGKRQKTAGGFVWKNVF